MSDRPNVIVIVTDDQGYGDLSCLGDTDVRTPHLDALCAGGARLTDWYANGAVCSPTRASLLTGRYPQRTGVTGVLPGHRETTGLTPDTPTLATALRERGYRTSLAGKWHLGVAEPSRPQDHGFDRWFGHLAGCIDYYSHVFYWGANKPGPGLNPSHDLWEDGVETWHNGEYMTDLITDHAVGYVREAAAAGDPFFLYLSYNAPHYPMHAPAEYVDRFAHLPADRRIMAAMLAALDDGVGQVMAEVERLGLAQDTLTFFTSDNGPSRESRNWLDGRQDPYYGGTSGGLRGHKRSLFDGGIRVPGAVHWPGTIPPGQVLSTPCATMDVAPTVLAATGAPPDPDHDGVDLLPLLARGEQPAPRDLFWAHGGPASRQTAVRRGPWKLVLNGLLDDAPAPDPVHLSNLGADTAERHNLADDHPDLVHELTTAAAAWRTEVGAP